MDTKKIINDHIDSSIKNIQKCIFHLNEIELASKIILKCFSQGGKLIIFGNGGSAADAQHIAAELIGRYKKNRQSLPAIALTTDTSVLTSILNDYSADDIFSRQCQGLVNHNDVVMGISTSGNSINVINGLKASKKLKATIIGLIGNKGGKMKKYCDLSIIIDSKETPHIQEAHRVIYHILCDLIEQTISRKRG